METTLMDEILLPVHPTLLDPRTGEPLRALGWFRDRPLWPMMGGSEGEGTADTGDDTDSETTDDKDATDDGKGKSDKEGTDGGTVPLAKHEDLKKKLGLSDRKRQEAEEKLKKLELKDLPEGERLIKERDEAIESAKTLEGKHSALARRYAFLLETQEQKIRWKNPKAALKLAELEALEISEDGSVEGIADAVAALIKEHGYLVDDASDSEDEGKGKKTPPRSGSPVGSKGKGKPDGKPSDEELRRMFPALNR